MPEHPKDKKKKKITRQEWIEKYGSDTAYFANFLSKVEKSSNKSIRTIILEESKRVGVDPNFLYTTLMAEGLDTYLVKQEENDLSHIQFPIDGYNDLGLDRIGDVKKQLFRKGYLDERQYNRQVERRRAMNEKGELVISGRFKNLNYGVRATAAFIKNSNDKLNKYLSEKDIKLNNEQKLYFQNVAYNSGTTNANKMVTSYKTRGFLKDNDFIKTAPNESWKEIRKNVGRRYGAMIGLDEQNELKFNTPLREPRVEQKPVNVFGTPFVNEFKTPDMVGNIKRLGGKIAKKYPDGGKIDKQRKQRVRNSDTITKPRRKEYTLGQMLKDEAFYYGMSPSTNKIEGLKNFATEFVQNLDFIDKEHKTPFYKELIRSGKEHREYKEKVRQQNAVDHINRLETKNNLAETKGVPKAIYGALITAGFGLLSNVLNKGKENSLIEAGRLRELALMGANKGRQDEQLAEGFEEEGVGLNSFYQKYGGNIDNVYAKGGELVPLSSDAKEAVGPGHEGGGIDLYSGQEKVANIEGKEVLKEEISETKVYSDELTPFNSTKTFAELVKALAVKKGKMEKSLSTKKLPKITEDTYRRQIASLDRQEDELFNEQESLKAIQGIENPTTNDGVPESRFGRVLSYGSEKPLETDEVSEFDFGTSVVPYLDNVVNLLDTFNKPKIPEPVLAPVPSFNTKVNVNDQLSNINNATQQATRFIKENTSNSNVARGNVIGTNLRGAEQRNTVLAKKENQERNLQNQASRVQSRYAFVNANIANRHLDDVLDRQLATRKEITANVANAVDDYGNKRIYDDTLKLANRRIDVNAEISKTLAQADDNFKTRSSIKGFIADNQGDNATILEYLNKLNANRSSLHLSIQDLIDKELKKYQR